VAVKVNVVPEVVLAGAVTVTVYGGVSVVPTGDPLSEYVTDTMGTMSAMVTLADPLWPGDN
jgi:hypothetical protein